MSREVMLRNDAVEDGDTIVECEVEMIHTCSDRAFMEPMVRNEVNSHTFLGSFWMLVKRRRLQKFYSPLLRGWTPVSISLVQIQTSGLNWRSHVLRINSIRYHSMVYNNWFHSFSVDTVLQSKALFSHPFDYSVCLQCLIQTLFEALE